MDLPVENGGSFHSYVNLLTGNVFIVPHLPGGMPQYMPDRIAEHMSERMSDRMSEHTSH